MRFSSILRTIIRPCLINLVGVSSLQDCQDKFKCKSLVDENTSESCIVTEVLNEEQIESIMDFKARTGVYAEDLLYNYRNESPDRWLEGSFVPPNWLSSPDLELLIQSLFHKHFDPEEEDIEEIPCFSFAVSINGKLVLKKGFRIQDKENEVCAHDDMVRQIGSITKTFTALMIMKLIEEEEESGRDDRITYNSFIQDLVTPDVWPEHMLNDDRNTNEYKTTVGQLLRHTAGLKSNELTDKDCFDQRSVKQEVAQNHKGTLQDSVNKIICRDINSIPDKVNSYSNYGYQLLALVYEKRTGRSFVEDLRDELVKMGLYDTDFDYAESLDLNRVRTSESHTRNEKCMKIEVTWHEASFGLKSTVSDLVKYGNIMWNCFSNSRNRTRHPIRYDTMTSCFGNLKGVITDQKFICGFKNVVDLYQAHGWFYEVKQPVMRNEDDIEENLPYRIMTVFHDGATPETLSYLYMSANTSNRTVDGNKISDSFVYPLGEQDELECDNVVGALVLERCSGLEGDKLLREIMDFVLAFYRHGEEWYLGDFEEEEDMMF